MDTLIVISLFGCLALGGVIGFVFGLTRSSAKAGKLTEALQTERNAAAERLSGIKDTFSALATEALQKNNENFLNVATQTLKSYQLGAAHDLDKRQKTIEEIVKPVRETLDRFELNVRQMEKERVGAYEGLTAQVRSLFESQQRLRTETGNLVTALKSPRIRGRWGEIQLRRVVELAGMIDHCDFFEQQSVTTEDGRLRPDMIVRLPGNNRIVIDAKSPLDRYLLAMDAADETAKEMHLAEYAVQIRGHASALSAKSYWDQFTPTPEFVFMFLPGESFFSAALEVDPSLIEFGVTQRVIVATPTTLIALLKAVSYGWRQERLAQDAEKIGTLGKELYERVCKMGDHFVSLGSSLRAAVERYNDTLGTLESRVLVSARRFKEMPIAATDRDIKETSPIDLVPREIKKNGEQPIVIGRAQ